jgi:hypothetical protein
MKSALESKSDHVMPLEFFHDILDEHFTESEVEKQLETALNWGRYAEIFSYDPERRHTPAAAARCLGIEENSAKNEAARPVRSRQNSYAWGAFPQARHRCSKTCRFSWPLFPCSTPFSPWHAIG